MTEAPHRGASGVVPPAGFEPALPPPEGGALSPELRGPNPISLAAAPAWSAPCHGPSSGLPKVLGCALNCGLEQVAPGSGVVVGLLRSRPMNWAIRGSAGSSTNSW